MKDPDFDRLVTLIMTERRTGLAFLKHRLLLSDSKVMRYLHMLEIDGVLSPEKPGGARDILRELLPYSTSFSQGAATKL